MWGVEVYDAALNSVRSRDMRDDAEKRRIDAEKNAL